MVFSGKTSKTDKVGKDGFTNFTTSSWGSSGAYPCVASQHTDDRQYLRNTDMSRRDHRLACLNQRDSCTVFYCTGGLFFYETSSGTGKTDLYRIFYYGGTLYEQCILHVPGGTFADCRNRPGARPQRITSSGVPAKIRSQHLRPHRHRIHAKKDLGRIDRTHASHAPLRCHHHSGSQHHPLLYRRRVQLSRMRRHLCGHLPVGSHHHRYGRQKRQGL